MSDINVSNMKEILDKHGILIIDDKHARFISIFENNIHEHDLTSRLPKFHDRAGYFQGPSGGGISDELNIKQEYKKRFYKSVIEEVKIHFQPKHLKNLIVMCPSEDISLIRKLLDKNLTKSLKGIIEGNYIKESLNEILGKIKEEIK